MGAEEEKRQDDNMSRELPSHFGWQDHEEIVLYDDEGNRISEKEWRTHFEEKERRLLAEEGGVV